MGIEYLCNRCEETFGSKLELVMHFWLVHGITIEEAERETDAKFYGGADSGCREATTYLGYPSSCSSCPFSKCVYDVPWQKKKQRTREMRKLYRKGVAIDDIAVIYSVHPRTVKRAVQDLKGVGV